MSAVNLDLPTFCAVPGLFFQRQEDGSVRVMTTNGENPLGTGANLRSDFTVPVAGFASVVASVSIRGDNAETFHAVEDLLTKPAPAVVSRRKSTD